MLNVEATSADRSRYEDVTHSQLEVLDREFTISLVHTTVKYERLVANIPELFEQFIDLNLLLDEYEDTTFIVPFLDDHDELVEFLLLIFKHLDALLDCRACLATIAHDDLYR